jgi:hypothetical protein
MFISHSLSLPPRLEARSAKVGTGFASDRASTQMDAHDLTVKPLHTLPDHARSTD